MKFLGYNRVHGTKEGREYDFVNLVIEREECSMNSDKGGSQIVMARGSRGYSLPSIPTSVFLAVLKRGLKIGDEVQLYRDFDNQVVFDKV